MSTKTLNGIRIAWIVLSFVLAAVWRVEALLLLAGLALMGPALRASGALRDMDERERTLDYQASHYALLLLYLLVIAYFGHSLWIRDQNPEAMWYLVLVAPMLVRGALYLGRAAGLRRLGLGLGFTFGAVWFLFTVLSHGISLESLIESVVGSSLLIATLIALKWPRVGGALLVVIATAFAVFFMGGVNRSSPAQYLLMTMILPLPPLVAGVALFVSGLRPANDDEFADLRGEDESD